jgi:hypothetical protein
MATPRQTVVSPRDHRGPPANEEESVVPELNSRDRSGSMPEETRPHHGHHSSRQGTTSHDAESVVPVPGDHQPTKRRVSFL